MAEWTRSLVRKATRYCREEGGCSKQCPARAAGLSSEPRSCCVMSALRRTKPKHYGAYQNLLDEFRDPMKATIAAAKELGELEARMAKADIPVYIPFGKYMGSRIDVLSKSRSRDMRKYVHWLKLQAFVKKEHPGIMKYIMMTPEEQRVYNKRFIK